MWPNYSPECRKEVDELLKKGGSLSAYRASSAFPQWKGPKPWSQAWQLEREIERKFKVRHAVAVNSGTAALHAGLSAIGVCGREVVTTPYSFSATASAIILAGGRPVFADVDPYTYCITAETVKRVITKKTAAILPVSLFGFRPDYAPFAEFGVPVVEDGCQAVGATRGGVHLQRSCIAQALSFNGGKNIPAGEGGALLTNDPKTAHKARLLINHAENFGGREVGYNFRLHEIVACIARHGLKDLEERNQRRRDLANIVLTDGDRWWNEYGSEHVFYCTAFKVDKDRAGFINRMAKRDIPVQASYTQPLHTLPAFRKYVTKPLPVVEDVHKRLCLLTTLTPDKPLSYAKKVAKAIKESLR